MAIFRLKVEDGDLSNAELVIAQQTNLDLEIHLESWLEHSPWALAQEPILWIGRQTTAPVEEGVIFPDLLGVDSEGNLVITESGEVLVSAEAKVGEEDIVAPKHTKTSRWSGEKPVKQVVWEAVQELTQGNIDFVFAPKDVTAIILKKYPNFNRSTVGCQIISDCVNHTSRHHYPGGDDKY